MALIQDGSPRASGVLDTIRSASANGVKIPSEFENKTTMDILVSFFSFVRNLSLNLLSIGTGGGHGMVLGM